MDQAILHCSACRIRALRGSGGRLHHFPFLGSENKVGILNLKLYNTSYSSTWWSQTPLQRSRRWQVNAAVSWSIVVSCELQAPYSLSHCTQRAGQENPLPGREWKKLWLQKLGGPEMYIAKDIAFLAGSSAYPIKIIKSGEPVDSSEMIVEHSLGGLSTGSFQAQLALKDQDWITRTPTAQIQQPKLIEHRSDGTVAQAAGL